MNFTIEQYNDRSYLIHSLPLKGGADPLLIGMLQNNRIPDFAQFSTREEEGNKYLCYDIDGFRSMKEVFTGTVPRRVLLDSFHRILTALEAAQDYMIEESSVVLDPQYIFLDPSPFRMALVCLPLMDYRNGNDLKSFFKSIMFTTIFDYNEPCDHVARIMNYLNSPEFTPAGFRQLLEELGANEATPEASAVREQDPFFDFDSLSQPEQTSEMSFSFSREDTVKTPLQEAEDLLSAALSDAPIVQEEAPVAVREAAFAPAPTSDPLAIADQLLSAALSGESMTQEEASTPKMDTAFVSSPPSEERDNSVRSRRSRARRETRDPQFAPRSASQSSPQSASQAVPVQEAPKKPAVSTSDPFDFLDSFTPTNSPKRTKAMEAADAILSALDIPPTEAKETADTDYFANLFSPKTEGTAHPTEDNFSDFTTPIVSSRRKSGAAAPVKTPEPRSSSPAPAPTKATSKTEEPFDFLSPTKTAATPTDAMRLADELLSAALAGISPTGSVVPAEESPQIVAPPAKTSDASQTTVGTDASVDLDFFSVSPAKKTAAMLEAESILDSLDLFAPSAESYPSPAPSEVPSLETVEALPKIESSPQPESVRKGGFFSRLRKKEDVPTPQAPAQPVVPYFGSDGETTILNVSQQMTMPSAPYLIRSSNGETIVLSKPVFRVGKDRDFVDYCISDNSAISRRHANFMVRNGDIFIIDTNSTNHTYINGVMIRSNTEVKLTHGDEIRLANEDFVVYCAGIL